MIACFFYRILLFETIVLNLHKKSDKNHLNVSKLDELIVLAATMAATLNFWVNSILE